MFSITMPVAYSVFFTQIIPIRYFTIKKNMYRQPSAGKSQSMASQHPCRGHAMSTRVPNARPQTSICDRFVHKSNISRQMSIRRHVSSEKDMGEGSGSSFHQQRMRTTAKKEDDDANKPPIAQDVCVRYGI
jgi:hypothetical protein